MTDQSPATACASHLWFLRTVPIFEEQSESLYNSADRRAKLQTFRRGDLLNRIDSEKRFISLVMSGQVKMRSVTENGKEIILDIVGPGDAFGPLDRVVAGRKDDGAGAAPTEAVALGKGELLRFDFEYFQELVQRRPTVVVNLTKLLGIRQRRLEIRLTRLLYKSSLGKVAGLIAELGERYAEEKNGKLRLAFRITHQEIASIIGTKRETVSECLADLEYRELIGFDRSHVVLLKPAELDRIP